MSAEGTVSSKPDEILSPGEVVSGRYRIDRLLGVGGMAAVWAGTNFLTGKRVALKVIVKQLLDSEEAATRFRREALAAGRIDHPNVVTVFDVVEHEGFSCIVMEFLEGESLQERLEREGAQTPESAVRLLMPALRGLRAAHQRGVVHRDIKPANIFLCRDEDGEFAQSKVLDFGISKLRDDGPDLSVATRAGAVMGTPAYMAPEQVMNARDIDQRADIFSMGAVLYQVLTGRTPFETESYSAMMVKIATEAPLPIATIRPDVPGALVAIVERAMAKDPAQRFQTVNELMRALETWAAVPRPQGVVTSSQQTVMLPSAEMGVQPRAASGEAPATTTTTKRWVLKAAVGAGVALGVAAAVLVFSSRDNRPEPTPAEPVRTPVVTPAPAPPPPVQAAPPPPAVLEPEAPASNPAAAAPPEPPLKPKPRGKVGARPAAKPTPKPTPTPTPTPPALAAPPPPANTPPPVQRPNERKKPRSGQLSPDDF